MRQRVAIVTPWFGSKATGGAESLARELAERLSVSDDVSVLTTTSSSFFSSWEVGDLPAGRTYMGAVDVFRFPLDVRKRETFDALNAQLLGTHHSLWHEFEARDDSTDPFIAESINSSALDEYLRDVAPGKYDAVIFLPYLYGVVVRGIESYPGRGYLLPCLHDEAYARIPRIRRAFHRAKGLLFNSEGEAELALRLYGPGILHKSHVIGSGIDQQPATEPGRRVVDGRYVLYLGRRDPTKNVDFLVAAFRRYRERSRSTGLLKLVLAGPGNQSFHDPSHGIVDMGFVDDETKRSLLAGAQALLQPSANESYSRVLMEAWLNGTPVVANGDCLATASAVVASNGGWLASGSDEWSDRIEQIAHLRDSERSEYADRGKVFATERADWQGVVQRLRSALGFVHSTRRRAAKARIDQVVQTLEFGDAISAETIFFRDCFRELGYESTIYAEAIGDRVIDEAETLSLRQLSRANAIVYHHSIRCDATESVLAMSKPKAMVYHNITPSEFFRPYDPRFADLLSVGRRQLAEIVNSFDVLVADSAFNAAELEELGARLSALTIPPVVDFRRFDVDPSSKVMSKPHRGGRWLFVGRVAPNKGILRLVDAFEAFSALDRRATLAIVGRFDETDAYYREVRHAIAVRNLTEAVTFTGLVDDGDLHAYYRSSDVFVTMSEHEGFCVPIVEAMMFDVPVIALAASAVPETLGAAGLLVEESSDAYEIACFVALMFQDRDLRERVIRAQRERRQEFFPDQLTSHAELLSSRLLS